MNLSVEQIWQRYDADEARLSAPLTTRMLQLAQLQPGMNVLDLATGRGEPAIPACHLVAHGGRVVGVDIAPTMLEMAKQRAIAEGVVNLELLAANAESLAGLPSITFDAVLARWGLMYMDAPVAALRAARHVCRPNARLIAALWAEPHRVDYFTLPRSLLDKHLSMAAPSVTEPGTFRFANVAQVEQDFPAAGWTIESIEEQYVEVMEAKNDQELIDWCRCFGLNRLLKDLSPVIQQSWERDLVEACQRRRDAQGVVRLGGVSRLVVCRNDT